MEWKNFYIKYRWMSSKMLTEKFGINKYDVDNFLRKPNTRKIFDGWRLSQTAPPENINKILKSAWEYYLTYEEKIDFTQAPEKWIPKLLSLEGISKLDGFSFLVNGRYQRLVYPQQYEDYRKHGFTNTAFGLFYFFPGREFLFKHGILPYMLNQTQKKATSYIDIFSMIEHVYMNFYEFGTPLSDTDKKEVFIGRYNEPNFLSTSFLRNYGVPQNFYNEYGGLKFLLEKIAQKYLAELGYVNNNDNAWSSKRFIKLFPTKTMKKCRYCDLYPVDLHHLLPQNEFSQYRFNEENVVPLCVNVHAFITRRYWNEIQEVDYRNLFKKWLKNPKIEVFDDIMEHFHEVVYGQNSLSSRTKRIDKNNLLGERMGSPKKDIEYI